jgi:hypothetical protein
MLSITRVGGAGGFGGVTTSRGVSTPAGESAGVALRAALGEKEAVSFSLVTSWLGPFGRQSTTTFNAFLAVPPGYKTDNAHTLLHTSKTGIGGIGI